MADDAKTLLGGEGNTDSGDGEKGGSEDKKGSEESGQDKGSQDGKDKSSDDKSGDKSGSEGEDKSGEGDKSGGEGEDQKGAPEKYEEFKLPDGVTLDPGTLTEFQEMAKTLELSQEGAQGVVDLQVKLTQKAAEQLAAERKEWVKAIKADEDFGGGKFKESTELARRAMGAFGSKELRGLLDATGFGDHPEMFRLMVNVGRKMGEAEFVEGKSKPGKGDSTVEKRMFGDMFDDKKKK